MPRTVPNSLPCRDKLTSEGGLRTLMYNAQLSMVLYYVHLFKYPLRCALSSALRGVSAASTVRWPVYAPY